MSDAIVPDLALGPPTRAPGGVNPDVHGAGHGHAGEACKNCGAALQGPFCHACGQDAHVSRSVLHVLEEVVHGITHFDSRSMRSLPMLFFRPGTLTRNYVMGQRAKYVPPFAMFLFSVFAMFLVFAFTGGPDLVTQNGQSPGTAVERGLQTDPTALADAREAQAELLREIEAARAEGDAAAVTALGVAKAAADAAVRQAEARQGGPKVTVNAKADGGQGVSVSSEDGLHMMAAVRQAMIDGTVFISPWPELNKKVRKKTQNPDLFFYKLQNTAYKFSFLLIPISVPLIWLMFFWKRGVTLYDHTVFALYSLSFVSLLLIVDTLLGKIPLVKDHLGWMIWAPPVHMFFQLKGAYALGWFSALWRTLLFVLIFSWVAIVLFLLAILALGIL